MSVLRQTPLNAAHRRLNAKMVDFGGWEMPLHYGSQIEEHHRVRGHAGMFDVSHMRVIDVEGDAAARLLERLLANDVRRLTQPGSALYSCMLNEQGGILDDLMVYFRGGDRYRLVVNAGTADQDLAWIEQQSRATPPPRIIAQRGVAIIAVQGPRARDCVWRALPQTRVASAALAPFQAVEIAELFLARTGYTGEDGFEIMLPANQAESAWNALLNQGVSPAGLGARDTLRLEAGMNLNGQDMDGETTPAECGLAWTVRFEHDFVGRRALENAQDRYRMLGLVLLERGVLRAHQEVRTPQGDGVITSGSYSPTLDVSIALARLPLNCDSGDQVGVEVRGRVLPARVVKCPFVRHGKSLIAGFPAHPH